MSMVQNNRRKRDKTFFHFRQKSMTEKMSQTLKKYIIALDYAVRILLVLSSARSGVF